MSVCVRALRGKLAGFDGEPRKGERRYAKVVSGRCVGPPLVQRRPGGDERERGGVLSPVGLNQIVSKLTSNFELRKARHYRFEAAHWTSPPREVPRRYLLKLYYRPFPRLPLRGCTHQGVRGSVVNA